MAIVNRRDFLASAGASGIAVLAGCIGDLGGGGGGGDNQLQKIGMTSYVRGGAWITAYVDAATFYARDIGIKIEVRPNQQSASKQVQDIRDFVNQGFDGIIVGVWQTGAAKGAINYAMKQNVPVFPTNADTASTKVPMYTGFSNYEGGQKSAEQMLQALKNQKPNEKPWGVVNVRGIQGNQSANQRSKGFLDVMKDEPDANVRATILGEYARDVALEKTQEWISANGKPHGIYSGNLSMGLGVVKALRNLNMLYKKSKKKHVVLTQMDGSSEVNPLVNKGYIDAAVDQPNYFYNPIAIKMMKKYVEAGHSMDVIPKKGTTVTPDQFNIKSYKHKDVKLWSEPIWAPAEMKQQNGHPWFKTNSIVITQKNATKPYLWGNIWG
jgi:ABC-type sugar transport system substrate-binding protein